MADSNPQNDPAPWYIRELRPYGLAGLLLAAACWYVFTTDANQKQQIAAKDALLQKNTDTILAAFNNAAAVNSDYAKSVWQLTAEIHELKNQQNR